MTAGITHSGEKDWHTPDTRLLEQLQEVCVANNWDPIPGLIVVKLLSEEQRKQLQLSKLPLAAAVALGADIPSSSSVTPIPTMMVEDDDELGYRMPFP